MSNLKNVSTADLMAELNHREQHPEWFVRELVEDGVDCDNDDFRAATDWMDDRTNQREE